MVELCETPISKFRSWPGPNPAMKICRSFPETLPRSHLTGYAILPDSAIPLSTHLPSCKSSPPQAAHTQPTRPGWPLPPLPGPFLLAAWRHDVVSTSPISNLNRTAVLTPVELVSGISVRTRSKASPGSLSGVGTGERQLKLRAETPRHSFLTAQEQRDK